MGFTNIVYNIQILYLLLNSVWTIIVCMPSIIHVNCWLSIRFHIRCYCTVPIRCSFSPSAQGCWTTFLDFFCSLTLPKKSTKFMTHEKILIYWSLVITDFCTLITDFCTVITDFCTVITDFCTVITDFCTLITDFCTVIADFCTLITHFCTLITLRLVLIPW